MSRPIPWLVLAVLLSAPTASSGSEPLDVVGIKTGITSKEAMATLVVHNPRIGNKWNWGPANETETAQKSAYAYGILQQITIPGLKPFIESITSIDEGPKVNIPIPNLPMAASERIRLFLTPEPDVVYGIERTVSYRDNQRPGRSSVLNALIEKYGRVSQTEVSISNEYVHLWYFDSGGKSLSTPPPRCADNNRIRPFSWVINGSDQVPDRAQVHCGSYVRATLRYYDNQNRELITMVEILALDAPLLFARARAAKAVAEESLRQQKAREIQEGEKRGGGKF